MKHSRITVCIDLLFCLVILPLVIMLVPVDRWLEHDSLFLMAFVAYLYIIYFVYRRAGIPSLFMRRRYAAILLLLAVLLAATALIGDFPLAEGGDSSLSLHTRRHLRRQTVWFLFLIVTGFSLVIELTMELFRQIISKQEIEAEKNKAELALYKAQINPHFLFNTLNSLYGLVLTGSEKAESAFVKFSDILKYMYTHAAADTIPVASEIEYIRQYVDLQSLRLNRHTHVSFDVAGDDREAQIPPMILITFVENAFKYGTSSEEDCTIAIRISVGGGTLRFETENDIMKRKPEDEPAIGIANCRKRLEMLYAGRFTLDVADDGRKFRTTLVIKLYPA